MGVPISAWINFGMTVHVYNRFLTSSLQLSLMMVIRGNNSTKAYSWDHKYSAFKVNIAYFSFWLLMFLFWLIDCSCTNVLPPLTGIQLSTCTYRRFSRSHVGILWNIVAIASGVCASSEFGKMCMCVVAQFPINCRCFIRIGILNKQQRAQEVLIIYTRSTTVHKNCWMIPIWWCKSSQIKSMLSQATNV